jgi:hypothetical protein
MLDILTGFHLINRKAHIIVIEGLYDALYYMQSCHAFIAISAKLFIQKGLKNKAIEAICELLLAEKDHSGIQISYNTKMRFSKRLYLNLSLDLYRLKLFEPLDEIVKKPLLYVRDMAPKPSFEGLVKLHQVSFVEKKNLIELEKFNLTQ